MKTNCVLLAAVLLSLSAWGAAQFVEVYFDHPYWPNTKYPNPPFPKLWHRDVQASFCRGGISLTRIVADPGVSEFIDQNTKIVTVSVPRKNSTPFYGPTFNASNGWYSIGIPFWLMALPPALWLAWRWQRARKAVGRGFEIATT